MDFEQQYQKDPGMNRVKGGKEQSFFLQTLLFTTFLVTVLKILTYALVST